MSTFTQVLDEIRDMHDKKQADYGSDDDPFANIRASELFGMPAWLGAVIRASDKIARIQAYARKKKLANETVEDSLLDLAVYAVIALAMYREENVNLRDHEEGYCGIPDCPECAERHEEWKRCQAGQFEAETGVCIACNARPRLGEKHMSWCRREEIVARPEKDCCGCPKMEHTLANASGVSQCTRCDRLCRL